MQSKISFFLILALVSLSLRAQLDSSYLEKADSIINTENLAGRFHGTIVIGNQNSIHFQKAIGIADRRWGISMSPNTLFDICSLNKSFIAALVLMAVEEGKLSLDDKLIELLASYDYSGSFDPEVNLHHMLCHISGLPNYNDLAPQLRQNDYQSFKRLHFSNPEYIDFISQVPARKPNQEFYYSNFAYHLLPIILEDVYQKSFPEILEEKITAPLGMHHTTSTTNNEEIIKNLATGYNYQEQTKNWSTNNFIDLSLGRRIFSTSHDLYLWAKAISDTSLLSSESIALMTSNHTRAVTNETSYGYGWAVHPAHSGYSMGKLNIDQPYIIHGGATEGYRSMLININHGQLIITFLSNVGHRTDEMELAQKIANLLIQDQ